MPAVQGGTRPRPRRLGAASAWPAAPPPLQPGPATTPCPRQLHAAGGFLVCKGRSGHAYGTCSEAVGTPQTSCRRVVCAPWSWYRIPTQGKGMRPSWPGSCTMAREHISQRHFPLRRRCRASSRLSTGSATSAVLEALAEESAETEQALLLARYRLRADSCWLLAHLHPCSSCC